MQQLQRFEEGRDRIDARDAEPPQEGVRRRIRARQRGRMGDGSDARLLGTPDLHRHDRLSERARPRRQPLEAGGGIEALDVETERRDALVLDQPQRHLGKPGLGLVAGRHQEGDRQAARLHGQVAGDVGRLGDDRHTPLALAQPPPAMLVGPQQRAVGIVDQPVAVRPDHRHVARRLDQRRLKRLALRVVAAGLLEAGGEADRPARAALAQFAHDVDGEVAVDTDETCVRCCRQIGQRPPCLDARHLVFGRMNRPDLAGKAHLDRLRDHVRRKEPAADHGDRFRAEQAGEVAGHERPHAGAAALWRPPLSCRTSPPRGGRLAVISAFANRPGCRTGSEKIEGRSPPSWGRCPAGQRGAT